MSLDGPNYCKICQEEFEHEMEYLFALRDVEEWKNQGNSVTCTTADFQRVYFQTPWVWGTFFRAIIPNEKNKKDTQLTGVGQALFTELTNISAKTLDLVPWDKTTVSVGRHRQKPGINTPVYNGPTLPIAGPPRRWRKPQGYLLHERCWDLVQRTIGRSLVEENLDLFVEASRQIWDEIDWDSNLTCGESEQFWYRSALDTIPIDEFCRDPAKYIQQEMYEANTHHKVEDLLPRDPVNIVELRDVIQKAIQRRAKHRKKNHTRLDLPPELRCLIVDKVEMPDDIRNMLRPSSGG